MLPHEAPGTLFLTDGGLETTLIFHDGLDLPDFAAFTLLGDADGEEALRRYWAPYLTLARERGTGFLVDTATWRASPDWGRRLGYDAAALAEVDRRAVGLARELADALARESGTATVVNGVVGPRGDGYLVGEAMSPDRAADYHGEQIATFAAAGVDQVSAMTMNHIGEATGIARAAREHGLPAVISFTVETDGRLPSGQPLPEAVAAVDADAAPASFMVNCAHPSHFAAVLDDDGPWRRRIGGVRANASRMSHAELDAAEELDAGDPVQLGKEHRALRPRLPGVTVLGGCCGTDSRHVRELADAWGG